MRPISRVATLALSGILAAGFTAGCGKSKPAAVTFSAPDASFKAVFPVTPKRAVKTATPSGATVDVISYEAITNSEDVGVIFTHVATPPTGDALGTELSAAIDSQASSFSGTVSSKADVTVAGQPGKEAVITRPGAVLRARVVFLGDKFYAMFGGTSSLEASHANYDRILSTFQPLS
ncbi:MAG TPA: hypothetical protein VET24_11275 [Actinomycetota bacterium]|nr:hypothetical protein [Actinomycetota bacterium]